MGRKEESLEFTKGDLRIEDVIHLFAEKYGPTVINTLLNPNTNQARRLRTEDGLEK